METTTRVFPIIPVALDLSPWRPVFHILLELDHWRVACLAVRALRQPDTMLSPSRGVSDVKMMSIFDCPAVLFGDGTLSSPYISILIRFQKQR
jgi:hypothetical protein